MKRKASQSLLGLTILLTIALTLSVAAGAATVKITTYDVQETPVSGFGCWLHSFDGTITDTGRTVGGSVICPPGAIGHVLNYTNGTGTLNDGVFDTTHLLLTRNDDQGVPLRPVITLHLDNFYTINEIRLLRTGFTDIISATVQVGGTALPLTTIPIGGDPLNVLLDLRATALAVIPTNQLALQDFSASFFGSPIDQFGISEIEVDGTAVVLSPTDKEQCMNGGWKNFGFKNQGLCIESVVRPDR